MLRSVNADTPAACKSAEAAGEKAIEKRRALTATVGAGAGAGAGAKASLCDIAMRQAGLPEQSESPVHEGCRVTKRGARALLYHSSKLQNRPPLTQPYTAATRRGVGVRSETISAMGPPMRVIRTRVGVCRRPGSHHSWGSEQCASGCVAQRKCRLLVAERAGQDTSAKFDDAACRDSHRAAERRRQRRVAERCAEAGVRAQV